MPAYDAEHFDPPAPIARVTLRHPETGAEWMNVPMLIDSGAEATLILQEVVQRLGVAITPNRQIELEAFDGSRSLASTVRVNLLFANRTFRSHFLLIDQSWGILGRNILNLIPLLLDGPHLQWDVYRPQN